MAVTSTRQKIWGWPFMGRFLGLCLSLVLGLAVVLWLLYRTEVDAALTVTQAKERQSIHLANRTIAAILGVIRGDVLYLAEHSSLLKCLETGDPGAWAQLAADFRSFIRHRELYDQARFLDENGQELVRVNWNDGQPAVVPIKQLQSKIHRYYVRKTLDLDARNVYVSPFDLNLEYGVIERPIKPMIRFSAPVLDNEGRKRGLVMLNYRGQRLLDRLRAIARENDGGLMLLNAEGYWLLGARPEEEWGFMYPERQTMRFERKYDVDIWSSILHGPQRGQLMSAEGLFSYARIEPIEYAVGAGAAPWILVAHLPASAIAAIKAAYVSNLVRVFVILGLLLGLLSAVIAYHALHRQQAEARIRASETRFRGLIQSAPDAIILVNQNACITLVNSQAEKWFHYTRDELLGQSIEQLVPERFHKQYYSNWQRYLAKPITRPMGFRLDLSARRKDGSEFPVEINLSPLKTDQGMLVISTIRDVTARRKAEEAQRQEQARYRELVTNLPVGVYRNAFGMKGKFLEVNPAMLDIFEADSTEQLLAHHVIDLYVDPISRKALIDKIMRQGQVNGEELQLKTLRGREFYGAITAVMKKNAAGEIYFDGIVKDISARKQNERQIQRLNVRLRARTNELEVMNRELEAFSYSVSHDLRAPLRAMDGFSRILLNEYADRLDDKGRDRLGRVRAAAQHMAELIDDLLNLSRVTRTELKSEPVDLTQLANEIMKALRQDEPERAVQFSVQPGLVVQGDARLLRVAMDNLLGNAWKFTSQRAEAGIEVGCHINGEGSTAYFIRDNGVGFDVAYADKLFSVFQRLHDVGQFPGTGIGLATVQRVIHKHGGHIWAESAVDQGATFYFTLSENKTYERKDDTITGGRQS